MNNYLVTGGAGFIGSHMVRFLLDHGHSVRVLDNLITGSLENIHEIKDKIDFIEGDFRSKTICEEAIKDMDYVIHLGALPSVPRSVANPVLTTDINVNGTVTLLKTAHQAKVKRIVFASSSSVYGNSPELPRKETQVPSPLSPYAVSKLSGEYYMTCFYKLHGLETVCLRFFNVFGPRQNPNSQYAAVIPKFIQAVLNGHPPVVYGDGEQSRDFTFIDNVVEGIYRACHAEKVAGEVINLACGDRTSLNELLDNLRVITGHEIIAEYTDPRPGDVRHSHADISKARALLKFEPSVPVLEGLARTFKWYEVQNNRNHHEVVKDTANLVDQ